MVVLSWTTFLLLESNLVVLPWTILLLAWRHDEETNEGCSSLVGFFGCEKPNAIIDVLLFNAIIQTKTRDAAMGMGCLHDDGRCDALRVLPLAGRLHVDVDRVSCEGCVVIWTIVVVVCVLIVLAGSLYVASIYFYCTGTVLGVG
jgi:hypothetical protein